MKPRSKSLVELVQQSEYYFSDPEEYDQETAKTIWKDETGTILGSLRSKLNELSGWEFAAIEAEFKNIMNDNDLALGKIMKPIRFAICGTVNGPALYAVMALLGRDSCMRRLDRAVNFLANS